jgi:hypothetical protein
MIVSGKPILPSLRAFCKPRLATGMLCLMGAAPGLGLTEEHPNYAHRLDHPSLAGIPRRQPDRAYRDVLLTLRTFRSTGGVCFPSHATLADRARCSPSTVLRACQQGRHLGLIDWAERRVRRGWRWLRTSNAYRFFVPPGNVQAADRPLRSTNRQKCGGGESPGKKAALEGLLRLAAGAGDLLLARRHMLEERLASSSRPAYQGPTLILSRI